MFWNWSVLAVAIFAGCGGGIEGDVIPPHAPVVLPSPDELSASERGIDAVPEGDYIQIEWGLGSEDDLAGYEIFRRREGDVVDTLVESLRLEEIQTASGDTAFWQDEEVGLHVRYFYTIRAFDESGNRSQPSNKVDYSLLPKLVPQSPNLSEDAQEVPEFVFFLGDDLFGIVFFIVKVVDSYGDYIWISHPDQGIIEDYAEPGRIVYNADGRAVISALERGHNYRWRVDTIGAEMRSGSESRWMRFRVR